MSVFTTQEFQASGVATVIVILKPTVTTSNSSVASKIEKYFTSSERSQQSALAATTLESSLPPPVQFYPNLGVAFGTVSREGLAGLRAEKELVASVSGAPLISLVRPTRVADARLADENTWGISSLGIPSLWAEGLNGEGVLIGHLDTGVDGNHPTLKSAIAHFAEFDSLGREITPAPTPFDSADHGTHTAATIAGRKFRNKSIGVAPGSILASAIVIEGGNVVARVLGGMDWALGHQVRILNMSLGFRGWWTDFLPLTRLLRSKGVLPVFAVGNEGPGTSRSPGNYDQTLSVGAVGANHQIADFSSSQEFIRSKDPIVPDLVAPGVDVISAKPGGDFQSMDGTSMATPHISGLAALLWQAKPKATVNQIERAIFTSCRPTPNMDVTRGNRGIPNGPRALAALLNS